MIEADKVKGELEAADQKRAGNEGQHLAAIGGPRNKIKGAGKAAGRTDKSAGSACG